MLFLTPDNDFAGKDQVNLKSKLEGSVSILRIPLMVRSNVVVLGIWEPIVYSIWISNSFSCLNLADDYIG
jgi:hypothetical protein